MLLNAAYCMVLEHQSLSPFPREYHGRKHSANRIACLVVDLAVGGEIQ